MPALMSQAGSDPYPEGPDQGGGGQYVGEGGVTAADVAIQEGEGGIAHEQHVAEYPRQQNRRPGFPGQAVSQAAMDQERSEQAEGQADAQDGDEGHGQ